MRAFPPHFNAKPKIYLRRHVKHICRDFHGCCQEQAKSLIAVLMGKYLDYNSESGGKKGLTKHAQ